MYESASRVEFTFEAQLWLYDGKDAWHFVTLPHEIADEIAERAESRGFGSVRVEVTIGATTWSTSLFPDKRAASYLLPVKAAVRAAEDLRAGKDVAVRLRLVGVRAAAGGG